MKPLLFMLLLFFVFQEGNIPLQKACQYGHYDIALTLINRCSDIHSIDRVNLVSLSACVCVSIV